MSIRFPRIWRSLSASAATAAGAEAGWTAISTPGGRCARAASIVRLRASSGVAALDLESELLRVEPAREEDVVHDAGEPVRLARDHTEQPRAMLGAQRLVALDQRNRRSVHRGKRRPQLMRDRGDEVAAHPLEGALLGEIAERVDRPFGEPYAGDREPELAAADLERDALGAASGRSGLGGDRNPLGQLRSIPG